jgi:hypothetical protein
MVRSSQAFPQKVWKDQPSLIALLTFNHLLDLNQSMFGIGDQDPRAFARAFDLQMARSLLHQKARE